MTKELLFRVTAADCDWQTFRTGGPGGQHQNKVETGVRCIHRASGAVGESREHRSQRANKETAFARMAKTETFQRWHRLEVARREGALARIDEEVAQQLHPRNLAIEGKKDGRWVPVEEAID